MTVVEDTPRIGPALDRALAALEWTLVDSRRTTLGEGQAVERVDAPAGFSYVTSGRVTLWVGEADGLELAAGDLVLLPRVHHGRLRAESTASMVDVGLVPTVVGRSAIDTLPASMVVRRFSSHEPQVIDLIENMQCGWPPSGQARLGDSVICSRIATMVASVAVRRWFELGCSAKDWLREVEDPHISRALAELHRDLGRSWTVEDLARAAAMSRSAFAERFRVLLGQSPATYLAAARMDAAKELLARGEVTVTDVAHRLGYGSDAGFSRAFRRHAGVSPTQWRSGQQPSVA